MAELVFWKMDDDHGGAEQTEAHGEHAGDAAGAERHLEGGGQRPVALGRGRRADVAARGQGHADEAGEAGHEAAGDEGQGAETPDCTNDRARAAVVWLQHLGRGEEHDDGERDEDDGDRLELALEVGQGALLDRGGDLDHLRGALVGGEDALHQDEADGDGEQGGDAPERPVPGTRPL